MTRHRRVIAEVISPHFRKPSTKNHSVEYYIDRESRRENKPRKNLPENPNRYLQLITPPVIKVRREISEKKTEKFLGFFLYIFFFLGEEGGSGGDGTFINRRCRFLNNAMQGRFMMRNSIFLCERLGSSLPFDPNLVKLVYED